MNKEDYADEPMKTCSFCNSHLRRDPKAVQSPQVPHSEKTQIHSIFTAQHYKTIGLIYPLFEYSVIYFM